LPAAPLMHRRTTAALPRTGNDDGLPQLPPRTYRHSRQSSS
jgi:hypothetical protein